MNKIDHDYKQEKDPSLEETSSVKIREQLKKLEDSGELEDTAREIIELVSSQTSFFDDIYSVGFELNKKSKFSLQKILGKKVVNPAFVGPKIKYKDQSKGGGHAGVSERDKAAVFNTPFTLEEALAFLVSSDHGVYPESLITTVHEATHIDQFKKEEEGAGFRLSALANTTVNEALARRSADIPYHISLSHQDLEKYLRASVAPNSNSASSGGEGYRLIKEANTMDEKMLEWMQAFDIIDSLAAEDMSTGEIASWLVQNKTEFNKIRKENKSIDEIDFYLERISTEFPTEDREARKKSHQEESRNEFKKAQNLAINAFVDSFSPS